MFNRKIEADHDAYGLIGAGANACNGKTSALLKPGAYNGPVDASYSIINEWLVMRGDLESEADVLVKGKVYGNVKCKLLIVDENALIEGGIDVEEIVVRGNIKGVITATKVRLEKTASVDCEIQHQLFAAEEGARIKGTLRFKEEIVRALAVVENTSAAAH